MTFKVLQINIDLSSKAQDVALAIAVKENININFLQKPNRKIVDNMVLITDYVRNKKVDIWKCLYKTSYFKIGINNSYISLNIPRVKCYAR